MNFVIDSRHPCHGHRLKLKPNKFIINMAQPDSKNLEFPVSTSEAATLTFSQMPDHP
jgi:hypothetical protein